MGEWKWETGMNFNQIDDFERIRDYGLMVIYSNWSFLKNESKDNKKYKNRALDWVAYIAGKRESRRLLGDYILKQDDIDKMSITKMPPSSQPGASTCISRIRSMHHTFLMRLSKQQPNTSIYILMQCPIAAYIPEISRIFYGGPQYQCYPCGTGHCPRNAYHRNDGRSCRDGSFLM